METKNTKSIFQLILLTTLFACPETFAVQPPRLLVLDVQPKAIDKQVASSLTALLAMEVQRGGVFTVISRREIKTLLSQEQDKLMLGVIDGHEQMMARLGKGIDAPYVLASSVGRVGKAYILSLQLLDVKNITVIRRINQTLVGDETGLLGSVRTAALALNLEEKDITEDISNRLIDSLAIAEKAKTWFLSISPVFESPIGHQKSDDDILIFRPDYVGAKVALDMHAWRWLRAFVSLGAGFSINAQEHQETNDISVIYEQGQDPTGYWTQGSGFSVDYTSMRIPLLLGIKAIPEHGRFLPFALIGVGATYVSFSASDGNLDVFRESQNNSCSDPFHVETTGNLNICVAQDLSMKPDNQISELGLEVVAGIGAEYLLSHHFGIRALAKYELTTMLKSDSELRMPFRAEVDTGTGHQELGKLLAAKNIYHHLAFSFGLVVYW